MGRRVIAERNSSAVILNFIFAAVSLLIFGGVLYVAITSDDTAYRTMGIVVAAAMLITAVVYGVPAVLIMCAPKEIIVREGDEFILNGKRYALSFISEGQLKVRRKNGGQYSYGDIYVYMKNGKKVVCRGVNKPNESYSEFCSEVMDGNKKKGKNAGK